MKTDAKTMAEIYHHMADNIDAGIDQIEGIGYLQLKNQKWVKKATSIFDFENTQYCILPKTITVNGVEIPKPLDIKKLDVNTDYYTPLLCSDLYYEIIGFDFRSKGIKIAYKTEEEAIEASKKLFGIE